ncbi:mucin-17-like [Haliotis rufescens]|uniref:mucin-17-like n=1 Tax=Haliotis rufescens TaxID=6454 RepID=UPI00201EC60C|nr:mucin-17-like [Haliotis rufescens]
MDIRVLASVLLMGAVDAMFNMPANFPMPQGYPCDIMDKQCPGDMVCRMVATACFNPPCDAVMACVDPPQTALASCPSGFPVMAANRRTEMTCTPGARQCPKESTCFFDASESTAVCCWKVYKQGQCPKPEGPGFCARMCQDDGGCPGDQKCCSNGCGTQCMDRMPLMSDTKPGNCPMMPPTINGPCSSMCMGDFMCGGMMKCCPSSCGQTCINPQMGLPGMTSLGGLPSGPSRNFLGRLQSLFSNKNPGGIIQPSQMDSFFRPMNSPPRQASWQQQQASNRMQAPIQSGSMQQNQMPGMPPGYSQGMANSPQPFQSGYSTGPSPGYPNNMQNGYPTGLKPGFQASQQGYQTGSKPGYPTGSQSGLSSGTQSGPPTIAPQGFQTGSQSNFPSGPQGGFPMQSQPMFPPGSQSRYQTGSQQGYPMISQQGFQNRSIFSPMGFLGAQMGLPTRSQPTFGYPNNFQQGFSRQPQQQFAQQAQTGGVQSNQPSGFVPATGSQSGIQTAAPSGIQQPNQVAPQTVSNTQVPDSTNQQPSTPKSAEPTFLIDIQPNSNIDQQTALQTALESIMAKNHPKPKSQSTEPGQPATTSTEQPTVQSTEPPTEVPTSQATSSAPTSTGTTYPTKTATAGEWTPQTNSTAVDISDTTTSTSTAEPATSSTSSQTETTSDPALATPLPSSQNSPVSSQASSADPTPVAQLTQPDRPSATFTAMPQSGGPPKPGTCPVMSAVGTCQNTCMVDVNCLANYKCCNIGPCTVCMHPDMTPTTCSWEKRMIGGC